MGDSATRVGPAGKRVGAEQTVVEFKRRMRAIAAAALGFAFAATCHGTPASAESLNEALSSAYRYNPRLDAARATLRATDEEVARAMSGYRPVITGNADINYQNTNTRPDSIGEGVTRPKGY